MKTLVNVVMLAASLTAVSAEPFTRRAGPASQIERLSAEDRAVCEDRRAHARPAYKELILARCAANFIAKHERTID